MAGATKRGPAIVALLASLLGFALAGLSTLDYVKHLDRQVHDLHCGYFPGAAAEAGKDAACRAAMYSPYSALLRDRWWGGLPISLFAVGAFAFFAAFSLYLILAGSSAPRRAAQFFGITGVTPALASAAMAWISATKLGQFCKTCVGIYFASGLLCIAAIAVFTMDRRNAAAAPPFKPPRAAGVAPTVVDEAPGNRPAPPPTGGFVLVLAWLSCLAIFAVTPAALYVSALPSYASYVNACGKLEKPAEAKEDGLLRLTPAGATVPVTLFVDPLCPTCKAFHERLVAEGYFDQLDVTLVLFPLDSDCNWMLDRPVHPGACAVAKAVLCGEHRARQVLEWAYDNQEQLLADAKAGAGVVNVRARIRERWPELDACVDAKETSRRMDKALRYVVQNHLPISTPQMFVDGTRLCDEDTDIGLAYALKKLAPSLRTGT